MIHYVHSSLIYNNQKLGKTKCPSTEEWIKKMWCIYTMDYYSDVKKQKKFMQFLGKRVDLEDIILSEVTQSHDKHLLIRGY
jgi:hypothetical protein